MYVCGLSHVVWWCFATGNGSVCLMVLQSECPVGMPQWLRTVHVHICTHIHTYTCTYVRVQLVREAVQHYQHLGISGVPTYVPIALISPATPFGVHQSASQLCVYEALESGSGIPIRAWSHLILISVFPFSLFGFVDFMHS